MSTLRRYRLKTHEELLESGFALTPGGDYVHPRADKLTREMIEYASKFDQGLMAMLFECPFGGQWIDIARFSAEHFVAEPLLNVVK